jgi:hypothetical protein
VRCLLALVVLALVSVACSQPQPTIEESLEQRIEVAADCVELDRILEEIVDASQAGQISEEVAVELAEFVMFNAEGLVDDLGGPNTPAGAQCQALFSELMELLIG